MKKVYTTVCSIMVTALIGLIVWIHGFIKGMRGAKLAPEASGECLDALDDLGDTCSEIIHGDRDSKEERKGYSTIKVVDSEESDD